MRLGLIFFLYVYLIFPTLLLNSLPYAHWSTILPISFTRFTHWVNIQKILTECLLCARECSRCRQAYICGLWTCSTDQLVFVSINSIDYCSFIEVWFFFQLNDSLVVNSFLSDPLMAFFFIIIVIIIVIYYVSHPTVRH